MHEQAKFIIAKNQKNSKRGEGCRFYLSSQSDFDFRMNIFDRFQDLTVQFYFISGLDSGAVDIEKYFGFSRFASIENLRKSGDYGFVGLGREGD